MRVRFHVVEEDTFDETRMHYHIAEVESFGEIHKKAEDIKKRYINSNPSCKNGTKVFWVSKIEIEQYNALENKDEWTLYKKFRFTEDN